MNFKFRSYETNQNLGTEFKPAACPVTGIVRQMGIQHGKDGMETKTFNAAVGDTADCGWYWIVFLKKTKGKVWFIMLGLGVFGM